MHAVAHISLVDLNMLWTNLKFYGVSYVWTAISRFVYQNYFVMFALLYLGCQLIQCDSILALDVINNISKHF